MKIRLPFTRLVDSSLTLIFSFYCYNMRILLSITNVHVSKPGVQDYIVEPFNVAQARDLGFGL